MIKRILIVSDDHTFAADLKAGFPSDRFSMDMSNTVNSAIKQIITASYDLIVTDLHLPEKTGIELLMYLKESKFPGKIMVMTDKYNEKLTNYLKPYNVEEIITKPFKINDLEKKILDVLDEDRGYVNFESIDIISVMQILNIERKTSMLKVKTNDGIGHIYFENGEIINAKYKTFDGEEAVIKLIANNIGVLSVKPTRRKVKKTMEISFVKYMMEIMQTIDELRTREGLPQEAINDLTKELKNSIRVREPFQHLKEIDGFLDACIFTEDGEVVVRVSISSEINLDETVSFVHDILYNTKEMIQAIGLGGLETLQFNTRKGIIVTKYFESRNIPLFALMFLTPYSDVEEAKTELNRVVNQIIQNLL
jgi:DNA-binding response OmpR family regulator